MVLFQPGCFSMATFGWNTKEKQVETGSEQKIGLFGKSGLEEFRNDYEENGVQIRDDMERKMNIKGLGNPTGDKIQVLHMVLLPHKQPQLSSLSSDHTTPL